MISKDMFIGDVVNKYPHAAPIMLSYGLHCVGCHVNPYETIEQGALGHGMDEAQIEKMMDDLNKELPKTETKDGDVIIALTESAAKKAKALMEQDNKKGFGLRINVIPGGCSGFNYELDFENTKKETDMTYEQHGLVMYVDKDIVQYIQGMELDYVENLQQQGFKFNNPNAVQTCGCGSSFGV